MADITLYTLERSGAGLTSTNVCRVTGAVALRITTAEQGTKEYPLRGGGGITTTQEKNGPSISGKANLYLKTTLQEIDLAKCRWAVALVTDDGQGYNSATIYWITDGRCSEIERCASTSWARAQIEGRCCGSEFELPPQTS